MTTTDLETYQELRPYHDSEIPAAMTRISQSETLADVAGYAFPGVDMDDIRRRIAGVKTADEFQTAFVKPLLENIIKGTMSAFTMGGTSYLDKSKGHLFISDHRDIVLDGSLLQLVLISSGLSTSEITFGSNLISPGFVEDFGRSNKMFKIVRGGSARDLIQNSYILSEHLHKVVEEGRSIWISQRDGRTKDGNDKTDQGLVKMLTMYGDDNICRSLKNLNIVPVAISYEYESCDALKARELYMVRKYGSYTKEPGEDLRSIIAGVKQFKGHVHMEVCKPIMPSEINRLEGENNNEILRQMGSLIDSRIIGGYKLYGTNYIAYDIRQGEDLFRDKYKPEERIEFERYIRESVSTIEGDQKELFDIMIDIYANPVANKLLLGKIE